MHASVAIVDEEGVKDPSPAPPRLHCLGRGASPEIGADLRRLAALPCEALARLWQVLWPTLPERIAPEAERLLDGFCAAHRIDRVDLARGIKACRFLVREAAAADLPAALFADDLRALCPDAPGVADALLANYEPAKTRIR